MNISCFSLQERHIEETRMMKATNLTRDNLARVILVLKIRTIIQLPCDERDFTQPYSLMFNPTDFQVVNLAIRGASVQNSSLQFRPD